MKARDTILPADAVRKGSKILREFREFSVKGNMVDLAVGVMLGTAFGAVVNSLVKDVIMPPIGLLAGRVDFSNLFIVLSPGKEPGPYLTPDAAQKAGAVTLNYGLFVNTIVNFVIVALALFFVVRAINRIKREPEPSPATPAEPSEEVRLLREIRDLLKERA